MDYKVKKDEVNTTKKDEVNTTKKHEVNLFYFTIHSKHIDSRWLSGYGDTDYEDWRYKEDKKENKDD